MRILKPENVSRKLDSLGRITFPKGLRARYQLENDTELEIFTADIEGRECIVLAKPLDEKVQLVRAIRKMAEAGLELTDEQMALLDSDDGEG